MDNTEKRPLFSILKDTLGSPEFLREHEWTIKGLFPEEWTHILDFGQSGAMKVGFGLKLIGVPWSNQEEFGRIMVYLEKIHFVQRNGLMIRRNPQSSFRDIPSPSLN